MASPRQRSTWDELPDEILVQILTYLEPAHISKLRVVSRKLQRLCLDDDLWKRACFDRSAWYRSLEARRAFASTSYGSANPPDAGPISGSATEESLDYEPGVEEQQHRRHAQYMANWEMTFPSERISWYDEYVQRNSSISVNWLQIPRIRDRGMEAFIEARGMALYNPNHDSDGAGTMLAVSPLDDGSVCLWDVRGTRGKQGSIVASSNKDILFIDGPGAQNKRRFKKIDTGVTECVSVDHQRHRAYFAVQSHLIEVDLNRLEVVSRESFEWSITTMSQIHDGVPLTVGTSLGIHLHDFRKHADFKRTEMERVDEKQSWDRYDVYKAIFDPKPLPPYASLSQPTPISILHLPQPGSTSRVSDDIYVSGRFSNILHYDRRKFPAIVGSVYSGALIKSLTALPYPFSAVDNEVRRHGELSVEQAARARQGVGRTLVAGGGYKTKGSLEMYGLSSGLDSAGSALQNSTLKNRQNASSSTILSVINHGSKIVFSDGQGWLRWFERDGVSEIRRHKVGHSGVVERPSLFTSLPSSDDLARKILSTRSRNGHDPPNSDNVLFWTGEKLGMMAFTRDVLFEPDDFEEEAGPPTAAETETRLYSERMREALERQANEVKFIRKLGQGTRG